MRFPRPRWWWIVMVGMGAAFVHPGVARADDAPAKTPPAAAVPAPPPPPPAPDAGPADEGPSPDTRERPPEPGGPEDALPPVPPTGGPGPDVRERPPEPPPPPGDWDKDFRSRGVGLGPPLPPPDPFTPRPILYRHDIREVSMDARVKPVKRVPQWVDVIERHDLTEWRPMDIGDIARRLPNVIVADNGNPFLELPVIRGLGGTRVKVLTDGVWPTSDVLGLLGSSLTLWDVESTERVELYHGPGVYLKGLDSPGGMINIVPRRPRRHGCLSADVGGAVGYDSATRGIRGRAEADVGRDRIAALVGGTWTRRGDRLLGDGSILDESSYRSWAADLALDYFIDNRSRIGVTAQYVKGYDVHSPTAIGPGGPVPDYDRFFLALSFTSFDLGGVFTGTKASIALDSFLAKTDDSFYGYSTGIGGQDDAKRYQFNLQGNLYLFPCHDTWAELTVGYARLKRQETIIGDTAQCCQPTTAPKIGDGVLADDSSSILAAQLLDGRTFQTIGFGTQLTRRYTAEEWFASLLVEDQSHSECWDTHAGIRVDVYHNSDNRVDQSITKVLVGGAGGVARHLRPWLTAYANASGGWRRPTLDERNATTVVNGRLVFGNPDLDPELNVNGEAGLKASVGDCGSFQVAGFGHYVHDFIGEREIAPILGPTAELDNVGDVTLYGLELTGAWRPWRTLEGAELYGSFGTTRSTDTSVVANVPLLWRLGTRYSVPQPRGYRVRRWFADAAVYGASNAEHGYTGGDSYVTGEVLLGTGLDFGDYHDAFLNFGVTNLFDASYVPPASRLPAPGLSFFASLAVDM